MKYKFLSVIFIIFFITSSRGSHARRKLPRVQLSIKSYNDDVGYMKPISIGPNGKLNITKILTLLAENSKKEKHVHTSHSAEDKMSKQEIKGVEKRIEEAKSKEDLFKFKKETPKSKVEVTIPDSTGTDSNEESDSSDDRNEGPMMRNGETLAEADDLQYDLDDEVLRISLKK